FGLIVLGAILTLGLPLGLTGCKKTQPRLTNIPGGKAGGVGRDKAAPPLDVPATPTPGSRVGEAPIPNVIPQDGIPTTTTPLDRFTKDTAMFKANTVYFD